MRVSLHDAVGPFLVAAERFLGSDPFSTSVIAVMAARITAGTQPDSDDYLWATVHDGDSGVLGVAMQTPPHALFVSRMPAEAATALADPVARVGPVYTPPAVRRRGYGAAVTAEATAAAMTGGAKHVALYTDLANPTSNSIYQAIGYRPDHDAEERSFAATSDIAV